MMKLMVVEDETILRKGICSVGDWEKCGVEICAAVSNGKEALQQIEIEKPDIILTDVVMPIMDGLELAENVYEKYPEIKIILLSGHEEFEYVKKAMECHACNYLLKPAKIEKLIQVVSDVCDEISNERMQKKEKERLQKKLEQSIPIVREHYMNQLLSERDIDEEQIKKQFDFLNIDLEMNNIAVMVCELDTKIEDRNDFRILLLQLNEICQEVIQGEYRCAIFEDLKDRVSIVLNYQEGMAVKDFLLFLQGKAVRIQKEMMTKTKQSVSMGIGRLTHNICQLAKVYREAESALSYRFFMGRESIIYIGDIEREERKDSLAVLSLETDLAEYIKVGDVEGSRKHIEKYFTQLGEYSSSGQEYILDKIRALSSFLLHSLSFKDMEEDVWLVELENLLEELRRENYYATLQELEIRTKNVILGITEKINQNRILRNEGIIEKSQKFIHQNLSGDVTLITVASEVYVSPNYLSFLFKENGENFKDYVVRIKMEKAKEMIESGLYTMNQIAIDLGYKDGRYLSQVYKKYNEKA